MHGGGCPAIPSGKLEKRQFSPHGGVMTVATAEEGYLPDISKIAGGDEGLAILGNGWNHLADERR